MSEHWTDRLSDYIDGDVTGEERRAIEAHLAACDECAGALDDLRRIVAAAGTLEDRAPEADLWPGIAARIGADRPAPEVVPIESRRVSRRWISLSLPQAAAAAIAFLLIGAAGVWLSLERGPATGPAPVTVAASGQSDGAARVTPVSTGYPGEGTYADAVGELERTFAESRDRLDPETVRTVERNLAIIDQAIRDTREALAADPTNAYLNRHLATTMQRKVDLLRRATTAAPRTI